jgi:hypothetical protein
MQKLLSLSAVVVCLVMLSSCSDDDDASRADLLTAKSWSITKYEVEFSGQSIDITEDYMDCEGDNVMTFSKDGKYNETPGANTCGYEEALTGTWSLTNGDKTISTTIDGDTDQVEIHTLTSTTLKVNGGTIDFDTNGDGVDDAEVQLYIVLTGK